MILVHNIMLYVESDLGYTILFLNSGLDRIYLTVNRYLD